MATAPPSPRPSSAAGTPGFFAGLTAEPSVDDAPVGPAPKACSPAGAQVSGVSLAAAALAHNFQLTRMVGWGAAVRGRGNRGELPEERRQRAMWGRRGT